MERRQAAADEWASRAPATSITPAPLMPELPEVESLRRDLAATLVGRGFASVDVRLPKQVVAPPGLTVDDLIGKRIEGLWRRAKFLIFDLSDGLALVFHLRLAGQLVHRDGEGRTLAEGGHPVPTFGAPLPHQSTHVIFHFDDGSVLYLTDIRQFGRVWILRRVRRPAVARPGEARA